MEWGRTKNILIIAFLALNILLFFQLWVSRTQMSEAFLEKTKLARETERILQERDIRLAVDIPDMKPRLKEIAVVFHQASGEKRELEPPIVVGSQPGIFPWAEALKEHIAAADDYRYDPYQSGDGVYVLSQLYDQLPLFEVNVRLYEEGGKIVAYDQHYAEVRPAEDRQEQTVLSAYLAVNFLAENVLPPGTVIEDIQLGYHGQLYNSEFQVPWLFPKWRIVLAGGEMYYVHAINGAVEKVATKEQDS